MTDYTIEKAVEEFNINVTTVFNKKLASYEPELWEILYQFKSGAFPSTKSLISYSYGSLEEWKGSATYKKVGDLTEQIILHNDWAVPGVAIPYRDFIRASQMSNITNLNPYEDLISNFPIRALNGRVQEAMKWLKAGTSSTYGTCFDGEPLFSTSHEFDSTSGSQSNLLSGSGTTTSDLADDLKKVINALGGFYNYMDYDNKSNLTKSKLNPGKKNILIICDTSLETQFNDIRELEYISVDGGSTQNNTLRNTFKVASTFLDDPNDWFALDISEPTVKPIFFALEDEGRLVTPQDNPSAWAETQELRYSFQRVSFGLGYGAWWKVVKVDN